MFAKQPPPSQPEPNGVEIKVKFSEATLIKLLSWTLTILLGSSGLWHVLRVSVPIESIPPTELPAELEIPKKD